MRLVGLSRWRATGAIHLGVKLHERRCRESHTETNSGSVSGGVSLGEDVEDDDPGDDEDEAGHGREVQRFVEDE